jgi:hypothetical protein
MIKKFIVCFSILLAINALSQEGTASPYSFYGIGDVRFKGATENQFMGGLSVMADSIHINLQNPAAIARLKYTTFSVAGGFNSLQLKSTSPTEKAQRTTLNYLAVGVPIGKKLGANFGLIPYSSVGYKVRQEIRNSTDASVIDVLKINSGTGGVNKVFLGFGYKLSKTFSVGIDAHYNFGTIETINTTALNGVSSGTINTKTSEISGLNFNLGAMYQQKITNKLDIYSSLAYTPHTDLKFSNTSVLTQTGLGQFDVPLAFSTLSDNKIKLPSKMAFGVGVGEQRKWLFGAEFTSTNNSGFGNRFGDDIRVKYDNGNKISLGGYYIPNYNSFTNYFNKVTYRGGFRYENTGMILDGQTIKEQAFTAGLGLPLGGTFSNLNIGVEYGKRGTAKANLVQENFLNVVMSLSLNDLWFIKRKYD